MSDRIRVLVADDHPLYRAGLRMTLSTLGECDVVAEASNGRAAVTAAAACRPAVAVVDINMPEMNGVEATRRIVEADADIGVLILTMFEDDDSVFAAMRAGARGYVLKDADEDEIVRAVRAVADGEIIFGAGVAERVLGYLGATRTPTSDFPLARLSDREREVLQLVAGGLKNPEIAERLFLSAKTVRNLVSAVFAKLQVTGRAEAIDRARRAGLGEPPPS